MSEMKKITQRDFVTVALEMMKNVEGMELYIAKGGEMLTALDKKKASSSMADEKKAKERVEIEKAIVEVLTNADGNMTCSQIASELGLTPQKITPRMGSLVADGKVKTSIEKRVKYYSLA